MARKRKSKPTGPRRSQEQRVKDRLDHAREDARILGLIPTEPEVTPKPEKVDPSSQSTQRFPRLIGQSIRRGWAVPDEKKPGLVDELISVVEDPEANQVAKVMAFNSLASGDKLQHERDQEYVKLDRVLEICRGVLESVKRHVQDQEVVKAILTDTLHYFPGLPALPNDIPARESL